LRPFLVFRCSKCQNFTNAPVGQKRRRCSYCGNIIDIRRAATALFDTPEQASLAVKAFNASRGGDEFEKAVERSRERIKKLMPAEEIRMVDIAEEKDPTPPEGKRKQLLALLRREAGEKPCALDRFEDICEQSGLEWGWVENQLQNLANAGSLIFPRPWSIRVVGMEKKQAAAEEKTVDVSSEILVFLQEHGGRLRVGNIIGHFGKSGVPRSSVESSLERLMQRGDIYEPRQGEVSIL
jgi:hypothetical protein